MPIPRALIQKSVNYIVSTFLYDDAKEGLVKLNASLRKNLIAELLAAIFPQVHTSTNVLVIGSNNKKLEKFLAELKAQNIIFPNCAFLLYSNGISYQKSKGEKLQIVNLKNNKAENEALQETARAFLTQSNESSDETAILVDKFSKFTLEPPKPCEPTTLEQREVTPGYHIHRRTLGHFFPPEWQLKLGIKTCCSLT